MATLKAAISRKLLGWSLRCVARKKEDVKKVVKGIIETVEALLALGILGHIVVGVAEGDYQDSNGNPLGDCGETYNALCEALSHVPKSELTIIRSEADLFCGLPNRMNHELTKRGVVYAGACSFNVRHLCTKTNVTALFKAIVEDGAAIAGGTFGDMGHFVLNGWIMQTFWAINLDMASEVGYIPMNAAMRSRPKFASRVWINDGNGEAIFKDHSGCEEPLFIANLIIRFGKCIAVFISEGDDGSYESLGAEHDTWNKGKFGTKEARAETNLGHDYSLGFLKTGIDKKYPIDLRENK